MERSAGRWSFSLPDAFGRATVNGVCSNTLSYASEPLRDAVVKATRGTGGLYGYNVSGVSLSSPVVHGVNYYDDYSFIGTNGVPASLAYAAPPSGYGVRYTGGSKGLLTGTVTARLDASGVAGYDYTAYYYDDRGRIVQTRSTNALGGTDIEYVAYNFVGDPVKRRRVHTATGKPGQTEVYSYTYDHAGRLLTTKFQPGSGPEVTLVSCTYDDLGRLKTRTPHGIASAKLTYSYNLRGWLTAISGNKFSQALYYNTGNGTPCYNGNISSMTWKAGNETTLRGYKFTYDGLNRMLDAVYGEGTSISSNANRFTEKVTGYDKNGNILALQRYGQTGTSSYGLIDNLTFTLDGNQLNRVDDAVTSSAYNNGFEFKDAVKQANEYAYDANGNLTKDLNKNISNIQYNSLNLPSKVTFTDGSTIEYTYAADGTKLRTKHVINGTTTTTDYCGNVIYENGVQKLLLTEAGYLTLSDSKYHYYLQDHQGNNRVVIDQNGTVEETNHYYPFGGVFANSTSVQPYKYNGKELDTKKGLNWYDYGARHYDAAVGRFHTQDRFAEKYYPMSPYQYAANCPMRNIDVNGDSIRVYTETTSNYGLGHAWISAGEGENMIVYTYGRYDGTNKGADGSSNSIANGPGVLVKLTGEEALQYNANKSVKTEVSVFTVTDVPDTKLVEIMDEKFNSSMQLPTNPQSEYKGNSAAHVIDEYDILRNNCATTVSKALNAAGSNILKGYMQQPSNSFGMWKSIPVWKVYNTPLGLQNHMKGIFK